MVHEIVVETKEKEIVKAWKLSVKAYNAFKQNSIIRKISSSNEKP